MADMNRVVLLLNLVILVVMFVLALSTADSQAGMLSSASGAVYGNRVAWRGDADLAIAHLRVAQSLGGETLDAEQLRAIHDAVTRYRQVVRDGVAEVLVMDGDEKELRRAYDQLSKRSRGEVEQILARSFRDSATVARVSTQVIRCCG